MKGYKTLTTWISVKDRLPKISGNFLVSGTLYVSMGWFCTTNGAFYMGDLKSPFFGITHWQPLPEPPKGE